MTKLPRAQLGRLRLPSALFYFWQRTRHRFFFATSALVLASIAGMYTLVTSFRPPPTSSAVHEDKATTALTSNLNAALATLGRLRHRAQLAVVRSKLGERAQHALDTLHESKYFASKYSGTSEQPDTGAIAFETLRSDPKAQLAFQQLSNGGTASGQLYGLAGLYFIDKSEFGRAAIRLATSTESVETSIRGIAETMLVQTLIESEENRSLRLQSGITLKQSIEEPLEGWTTNDFIRGYYPWLLQSWHYQAPRPPRVLRPSPEQLRSLGALQSTRDRASLTHALSPHDDSGQRP